MTDLLTQYVRYIVRADPPDPDPPSFGAWLRATATYCDYCGWTEEHMSTCGAA